MTDKPSAYPNFVPGFDFLQGLVKNAGAALPGVGQWVAPTLDPQELEKRISELRTVQFWLEQNAKMLAATIQALEVQRMTLSTLKTMNVQMADLQESMKIKPPEQAPPTPQPESVAAAGTAKTASAAKADAAKPAVDPLQWWGALTKQFTELASNAIQQGGDKGLAAAMGKSSIDGVADHDKAAVAAPKKAAAKARAKPKRRAESSKKAAKGA